MQQQTPPSVTLIFCAAAPLDTSFLAQWEMHLLPLMRVGWITAWSEQHLIAGADRLQQINDHLDHAHVIVFLLSAEFFASDECMALMERALKGSARVIPLLLRPVDWKTSKLADLACLPANGQFVTTWDNLDQALHTCVDDLRQLLGLPAVSPQTREPTRASARHYQNRERMLRRLRRSYEDLMSQSLQGAAWLELGITSKPNAVQNAATLLLRVGKRTEQLLPPSTSITQAYDKAEHELLILGEPGAGKSTLLLDLAGHLVVRAETDETHPLPMILPLSSWAIKRPKLEDWIVEQISEVYDVPHKVGTQWVKEGRILPLLDGLDEMEENARPGCIAAINAYHRDHMISLVVCSRTSEYKVASEHHRIALQGAVVVQPLTYGEVEAYLIQVGKPLVALHSILKKNAALYDLATTPLMLNILTLTYQGSSMHSLSTKGPLLLQQIWNDYVERMVTRKGNSQQFPLERTQAWLSYLARQMRDHNQTVFYLEHLQPDWLLVRQQRTYQWFGVHLPAIVIGVLMGILFGWFLLFIPGQSSLIQEMTLGGLLGGLLSPIALGKDAHAATKTSHRWKSALFISISVGLLMGYSQEGGGDPALNYWLLDGCAYLVIFILGTLLLQFLFSTFSRLSSPTFRTSSGRQGVLSGFIRQGHLWRALFSTLLVGLSVLLSETLSDALSNGLSHTLSYRWCYPICDPGLSDPLNHGLSDGLGYGLSLGLTSLLVGAILERLQDTIYPTERMTWTRENLRSRLFASTHLRLALMLMGYITIFVGLSTGLGAEPQVGLNQGLSFGLSYGPITGLSIGLLYWLLVGLYQSIGQEQIENQDRRVSNQGIKQSLRNSLLLSLTSGIIIGGVGLLAFGLSQGLGEGLAYGLSEGLNYGLGEGLRRGLSEGLENVWSLFGASTILVWMITGGLAVWRHYLIRLLIRHSRTFPWKAAQFLDDATARFLLRRVGGGYSFSHRLLLDHLTSVETEAMSFPNVSSTQFPHS